MVYFTPIPTTLDELKALYRKLAMKHHPDRGGNDEAMKLINNEYDKLFEQTKNCHRNAKGETYTRETAEAPEHFRNIVLSLIRLNMDGVDIELIGSFLWLSGNTKQYKDEIKNLGFKWSKNKLSWYLAPDGYRKRSRKDFSMADIRHMYGSRGVNAEEKAAITA
ncbi:MAG: molecular chaperone DnaJ [Oscillospiraceae bacterium]|nr:molecular chaperone DnaJ [Oscillospiraceae bacterium]MCL2277888.1 molecular chaperone DnaJ [Oscillospiraceae bacterium]